MKKFGFLFYAVVLWAMGPCSLWGWYQHFRDIYGFHLQESLFSCKILVCMYQTTWCHNSHNYHMNSYCCGNLSFHILDISLPVIFMKNKLYVNSVKTSLELYTIDFMFLAAGLTTQSLALQWQLVLVCSTVLVRELLLPTSLTN